jgi:imidazole glycerol phosphate synthase subunit HisF
VEACTSEGGIDAGADAVLAASIFHDDDEMTVGEVKRALAALGVHVWP